MKYCKEITEKICQGIEAMKGRVKSVEEAGISYEAFSQWMKKKVEFAESIKKSEKKTEKKIEGIAVMSIIKAMPNQWQAAAWWLERTQKKKYGKEMTLKGDRGNPLFSLSDAIEANLKRKPHTTISGINKKRTD